MPLEEDSSGYLAEMMLSVPELCKGNRRGAGLRWAVGVERMSEVNLNPSLLFFLRTT